MTDERIIAYLLEELPEDDLEQFEDDCFAQESWPAQIELVEQELIDSYLRNELDSKRRRRFEENYLTTQARQERVSVASALLRHVDQHHTAQNRVVVQPTETTWTERVRTFWSGQDWGLRAAAAFVMIAVIGGSLWLIFRSPSSPRAVASITLSISTSNRAEGAEAAKVRLPPGAGALGVTLLLPARSPSGDRYHVELENDNGEKSTVEVTAKDAQSLLVVIPAAQLPRGQYALKLFAVKSDNTEQRINGSYFFVVE